MAGVDAPAEQVLLVEFRVEPVGQEYEAVAGDVVTVVFGEHRLPVPSMV